MTRCFPGYSIDHRVITERCHYSQKLDKVGGRHGHQIKVMDEVDFPADICWHRVVETTSLMRSQLTTFI